VLDKEKATQLMLISSLADFAVAKAKLNKAIGKDIL
jgi:hypothetical protein